MSSQEPTRKRRRLLGKALTAEQLIKAVDADADTSQAAEDWWEQRAPTYARRWLLAKPKGK